MDSSSMRLGGSVCVDDSLGCFQCDRRFDGITSDYGFLASKHHPLPVVFSAADTPNPNFFNENQTMFDDGNLLHNWNDDGVAFLADFGNGLDQLADWNSVDLYLLLHEGFSQPIFCLVSNPRYL